ncbi:hypothetical protein MHYP_G00329350 [Metynnis hypsauchen]
MRGQARVVSGPAPWATRLLAVHNKVLKGAGPSSAARKSARGRRGSEELDRIADEAVLPKENILFVALMQRFLKGHYRSVDPDRRTFLSKSRTEIP